MKVLMLANARAVHTQRWARALSELGNDVTVISIRRDPIEGVTVLKRGIGPVDGGSKLWPLVSYLVLLFTLPFDLRRIRPDIVNPHYCITHGVIAALVNARPRVVNVWGSDLLWEGAGPIPWWRKALIRFSLRKADAIISTSKFMADAVSSLLAKPPPIRLVPFGVDTARFKPNETPNPHPKVRIGFVKSFAHKYAPDIFVKAAALAVTERDNLEFVMAGRGQLLEQIHSLAIKKGLEKHIHFPGFILHEDVAPFMRGLDILVNCSRTESFGVVICEASASGLPVIATDVGGVRETLIDGKTGILVPSENAATLANAILKLADDAELRMCMGKAGRQYIIDSYEWRHCVNLMADALEQTVSARLKNRSFDLQARNS